jgi:hypothetical protein
MNHSTAAASSCETRDGRWLGRPRRANDYACGWQWVFEMTNTRKILIVDDDRELSDALTEQLSQYQELRSGNEEHEGRCFAIPCRRRPADTAFRSRPSPRSAIRLLFPR